MKDYKYLIVGGGMAADSAVQAIRKLDATGSIGMITREQHGPYDRPPLSKGLWKGDVVLDDVWRDTSKSGLEIHLSRDVTRLDVTRSIVRDDAGQDYTYQKLLLATGGSPRKIGKNDEGIIYFRTVDDYNKLDKLAKKFDSFGIVGGGFIGSEIAAALTMHGKKVTMIFPEKGIGEALFPSSLSSHLNTYFEEKGVHILKARLVKDVIMNGERFILKLNDGQAPSFDAVVAGLGIIPETSIARSAGIDVGNGIIVDRFLQTSKPNIYAAGDVACITNPALGTPMRFEHEDNANASGDIAGKNMAGEHTSYDHLPFFYSDLFDYGYESVGDVSSRLETVADWKEEFEEGVVYYVKEGRVRGVLLWGVFGRVDEARSIVESRKSYKPSELKGLIPPVSTQANEG